VSFDVLRLTHPQTQKPSPVARISRRRLVAYASDSGQVEVYQNGRRLRKPHSPARGWNDFEEIRFIGFQTQRCTAGQGLEELLSNFLGILEGYQSRGLVIQAPSTPPTSY
jgi:hypothetical protein